MRFRAHGAGKLRSAAATSERGLGLGPFLAGCFSKLNHCQKWTDIAAWLPCGLDFDFFSRRVAGVRANLAV